MLPFVLYYLLSKYRKRRRGAVATHAAERSADTDHQETIALLHFFFCFNFHEAFPRAGPA
jgi:hypothetical protein